jgi:hypothetical protein
VDRPTLPSAFDPARSTVVEEETTPTAKVFRNPDSTLTAQVSATPSRFKDRGGRWVEIDLNLVPSPDGTLTARSAERPARLAARAGGATATVETAS